MHEPVYLFCAFVSNNAVGFWSSRRKVHFLIFLGGNGFAKGFVPLGTTMCFPPCFSERGTGRRLSRAKVWRGYFYMGRFGAGTPKRHVVWSPDENFVANLVREGGHMCKPEREALCGAKTARSYIDPKTGQRRHVGVKNTLKESQKLVRLQTFLLFEPWLNTLKTVVAAIWPTPCGSHVFTSCDLQKLLSTLCFYLMQGGRGACPPRTYTAKFGAEIARYFRESSLEDSWLQTCECWFHLFPLKQKHIYGHVLGQEFFPSPMLSVEINWGKSDFELFAEGLDLENIKYEDLGDPCDDASCLIFEGLVQCVRFGSTLPETLRARLASKKCSATSWDASICGHPVNGNLGLRLVGGLGLVSKHLRPQTTMCYNTLKLSLFWAPY